MTPAPSETAELVLRLRQQLILAQVRIMELEDERDWLMPRLAETEALLAAAQKMADGKIEEAAHLGRVLAETQIHVAGLQQRFTAASAETAATRTRLAQAEATAAAAEKKLAELRNEITGMKTSRSWRWTAWLR
jgi:chromosome segregation ATPase